MSDVPAAVREVDAALVRVDRSTEFLRLVTPINTEQAWEDFDRSNFEREPRFVLPPLDVAPREALAALEAIPVAGVAHAGLQRIFGDHREQLHRKLRMLESRNTPAFVVGSLEVFGGADPELLRVAERVLERVAPPSTQVSDEFVTANAFARIARQELAHYRALYPEFPSGVEIDPNGSGLVVSHGRLRVGAGARISRSRVEALLAHEIGTHVVTYVNGKLQPIQLLSSGLAGYEELQEGLASFAEYLVGGLKADRMRELAARTVAVHLMIEGAGFVDIFRRLHTTLAFPPRKAFLISMRVLRGGGLTKDAIYLRGLSKLLSYLREEGDFEGLLLGKYALDQQPFIRQLREEGLLRGAVVLPRHLAADGSLARLARARFGISMPDLVTS
ncbi:MAG: DUF1704 domain-containing protein [Myxococcota bacterium]